MTEDQARLRSLFERVENKENWKFPITAVIPLADIAAINEAVEFFTGSSLEVVEAVGENDVLVYANGYYIAIGA